MQARGTCVHVFVFMQVRLHARACLCMCTCTCHGCVTSCVHARAHVCTRACMRVCVCQGCALQLEPLRRELRAQAFFADLLRFRSENARMHARTNACARKNASKDTHAPNAYQHVHARELQGPMHCTYHIAPVGVRAASVCDCPLDNTFETCVFIAEHARTHARTHARSHARTPARMHAAVHQPYMHTLTPSQPSLRTCTPAKKVATAWPPALAHLCLRICGCECERGGRMPTPLQALDHGAIP